MTPAANQAATVSGHHLSAEAMTSLREAASATGVDFQFLVAQASLESGFRGASRSAKSSAAGIFQFTTGTWLAMMRAHGAKYGHAALAKAVKPQADGRLGVADPHTEKKILDLRKDVKMSALFAAEYAKDNAQRLAAAGMGHKPGAAELHLAHLLGPNGAIRFLKARAHDGQQPAASVVPAAAKHNRALFYADGGRTPQSVATVYRNIQQRIDAPIRQVASLENARLRPALGLTTGPIAARGDHRA
jgi:hypothetical protein